MTDPQYMTKIFVDTTKRKKVIFIKVAERQGKKLGTWVMDVLNEHLKAQFIDAAMKSGISFSALELKRREDGWVEVNPDTMHKLCRLAKIPPHYYDLSSEEDLADIVFSLYAEWKKQAERLTRSRKRFLRSQAFTSRLKTKRSRSRPWDEDCD